MKVAAVIRELENSIPFVSSVITYNPAYISDTEYDIDLYLQSEAENYIQKFKKNFPDIVKACWYIQILEIEV